ncbi:MAG: TonB-dependent receptor family protein [Prevotella sp.]|nr:TonB-dependent receptor family protein [Prevotella sp.]
MRISRIFITLGLMTVAMTVHGQTSTITGELIDSLTHESEPYATVRVYKGRRSEKPVAMSVTDMDGKFSQKVTGQGSYIVSFSSMGRKEIVRKVQLSALGGAINLGTLLVQDDAKQLEGVEVVAQKPLVKMETDRMTYDVQSDNDAKSNTVLDMLRKVPMVTVDGQDNITVNGQSSFKVYVDGKPNVMFSANPSQILKAMPASAVKSIEVVTNPGAKYDAEGVGGVLNIVMNHEDGKKVNMNGYNGNVSLTAGNRNWRASAFLSGQQGKLTYSANVMYNRSWMNGTETEMARTATDGSTMAYWQRGNTRVPFTMGNLSLGYELDSMSNIGATVGLTAFTMKNDGHPTTAFSGGAYGTGFSYGNGMIMENSSNSFNASVDYQRFFNKDRTSSLTLSYLFTTSPSTSENRRTYDALPEGVTIPLIDLYSEAKTRGTEHTVQADYTTPLGKNKTLNAGMKYISRRNSSDSRFYNVVNGEEQYNEQNSVNYRNTQDILAGYAEYSATLGKLGAKAGIRYERTWENVRFILGAGEDFKKNYDNLVPSASFTYNISSGVNLGVNYGMLISRPGISYLNPYVDRSNPTILSYGNPDLEVEKSHNVSLVFNSFTPKFMINVTLGENFANNQIEQYSFLRDNVLNTTYGNIVRSRWTNFNTFMNYALTTKTRLMLNAGFDYGDIRSEQLGERNHGWQATAFLGLQQTLPWELKWSMFLGGMTKRYSLQGYQGGFNMASTTLSKSLFKDKMNISLQYMVPFTGKLKIKQYSRGKDFENVMNITVPMQNIMLTVTWNFGNTKKQFQQHESKISNDFQEHQQNGQQLNGMGMGAGTGM